MVMQTDNIQKIGIVGAGTMGSGIGQMAAQAGYEVVIYDINAEQLDKAKATINKNLDGGIKRNKLTEAEKEQALGNITFSNEFEDLKADLVVEAVIEKFELKEDIFTRLAALNDEDTILASNTSSIPITKIATVTPHPERVVGMHFFNPAHIMKLVEVIAGMATDPAVAKTVQSVAGKMGKQPVMVQDAPGFIVNRVARHFYLESLKLLEEQVADVEGIDALMRSSGFKMGPFQLMDLIGIDSNHYTTQSMFESFYQEPRFRPSRVQEKMVLAGRHGRKTKHGFYKYE